MKLEFSLTEARSKSGAAVEISLLLQKLATLERLEKAGGGRGSGMDRPRERETARKRERNL